MKKTYLMPTIRWKETETEEMIAASYGNNLEGGFNLGNLGTTDAQSGNLSRKNDLWAEDEEE